MEKFKLGIPVLLIAIFGTFAFDAMQGGTIAGTIKPADAAAHAWAIIGTDTFNGSINQGGQFEVSKLKAGIYKVVIEGNPPYANAVRDQVEVRDGQTTGIGEIVLKKQ